MPFLEDATAACQSVPNIRKFWSNRATWQIQLTDDFPSTSAVYANLTRAATRFGENLLALEIGLDGRDTLSAFRARRPVVVEQRIDDLEYEKAIALSRLGSVGEAREILLALHQKRPENAAILSAIGRTFKDLAFAATHPAILASNLEKAHSFYLRAFELSGAYYPAINAATVALWQQNRKAAYDLAEKVKDLCRAVLQKDPKDYWAAATIAEAELILSIKEGEASHTAFSYYQRASVIAHHLRHWGDLSSTLGGPEPPPPASRIDLRVRRLGFFATAKDFRASERDHFFRTHDRLSRSPSVSVSVQFGSGGSQRNQRAIASM